MSECIHGNGSNCIDCILEAGEEEIKRRQSEDAVKKKLVAEQHREYIKWLKDRLEVGDEEKHLNFIAPPFSSS